MTGNWGIGTRCVITVYITSVLFLFFVAPNVCVHMEMREGRECAWKGEREVRKRVYYNRM